MHVRRFSYLVIYTVVDIFSACPLTEQSKTEGHPCVLSFPACPPPPPPPPPPLTVWPIEHLFSIPYSYVQLVKIEKGKQNPYQIQKFRAKWAFYFSSLIKTWWWKLRSYPRCVNISLPTFSPLHSRITWFAYFIKTYSICHSKFNISSMLSNGVLRILCLVTIATHSYEKTLVRK